MKSVFKILGILCLLLVLLLVAGYFILTNPGFQKRQIEKRLPEGSSLESVQVTAGSLELTGLVLMLPDGTRVEAGGVETAFKPLAALFDKTIQTGAIRVDDLQIDLAAGPPPPASRERSDSRGTAPDTAGRPRPADAPEEPADPFEALYAFSEFEWLLDIESIGLNGRMRDAQGNSYEVTVDSGAIRPGQETTMDASLRLIPGESLQGGLSQFDSLASLVFKQKSAGGFERFRLESSTSGQDDSGGTVLDVSQSLDLGINGAEETAQVELRFNVDLPRPELLAADLASMGAFQVQGSAAAGTAGSSVTLTAANLRASAEGNEVLVVDLRKAMTLGGTQNLTGELLDFRISNLPLAWLQPWLPEGLVVEGDPVSVRLVASGTEAGDLILQSPAPVTVGPVSVREGGDRPLLHSVRLAVEPVVEVSSAGVVEFELANIVVADRYGTVLEGRSSGRFRSADGAAGVLPAGVEAEAAFELGLQEVFQQPLLADAASILGGTGSLELRIDGAAEYPLQLQINLQRLRPAPMPGTLKDFRTMLQARQDEAGEWQIDGAFEAGPEDRPTSDLRLFGRANPNVEPIPFRLEVSGPRVSQADGTFLAAAFSGGSSAEVATPPGADRSGVPANRSGGSVPESPASSRPAPPPWAMLDGTASVRIEAILLESGQTVRNVTANARVSEPELSFSEMSAAVGTDGALQGQATVRYTPREANLYSVAVDFDFQNVDPSIFADPASGGFPVQGSFDGIFKLTGGGPTLEAAVEDSTAEMRLTGQEGVVTAFELDNRSQLGLLGVGILGESLNRPGITALSNTVPYFKDIRFDNFVLELTRGEDKRVRIPQLKFTGENLLVRGSGFVAASSLAQVMEQPLNLSIELGAKGPLTDYLETLNLLGPTSDNDGFRRWAREINIGGTLGDPDTEALMRLLRDAARNALNRPTNTPSAESGDTPSATSETEAPAEGQSAPTTPQQRRRDEVDVGLDLLNSIFGR